MKTMKMALLAGAAVAVSAAAAHADELSDLKAQVEALNARMAAMETAPSVPSGYKLLAISKGSDLEVPGLGYSDQDRVKNSRATIISVMPTADAPAGTEISWSGYVRAAIVYTGKDYERDDTVTTRTNATSPWVKGQKTKGKEQTLDDWDVKSRGQLKVVAKTDTAVGEVGVELKLRADFNGNGEGNVYMKTAWGYWAMTPELTLGGGYSGSLGNIGYGYDGACTCYYTDNGDVDFNPGDTTQMRLSYASGPFSMAVAIEDAGKNNKTGNDNYSRAYNQIGAAGEIKYSGDSFSGEISGVYRGYNSGLDGSGNENFKDPNLDATWQVGAGLGFNLGDIASLSLAAALGEGPVTLVNDSGVITNELPVYNQWWGVSGLVSANLSDAIHAEAAAGYKHREGDNFLYKNPDSKVANNSDVSGFNYDTYSFLGGLYYTPVDQLTIGVEGEWYTKSADFDVADVPKDGSASLKSTAYDFTQDNWTIDLVSVWRF